MNDVRHVHVYRDDDVFIVAKLKLEDSGTVYMILGYYVYKVVQLIRVALVVLPSVPEMDILSLCSL